MADLDGDVEEDEIITMQDVLNEQVELNEDADAVLGASDDANCTYQLGYVGRQALYACKTCSEKSGKRAGMCLACSLKCHDGHELFELYTKRNFRCDCGISAKFPGTRCELDPSKTGDNEANSYNQNFDGKYCTCKRPYPDPEEPEEEDVMIQCIACEDWFHGKHLETTIPEDYGEMICQSCTSRLSFLKYYRELDGRIDTIKAEKPNENGDDGMPPTKKLCTRDSDEVKIPVCELENRKVLNPAEFSGASFWSNEWRESLCRCENCLDMYKELHCSYLTELEDTILSYEEKGRKRNLSGGSVEEVENNALRTMPRNAQIEVLHGFNELKEALAEFLRPFSEKNEVVTKEHIDTFIADFKKKKQEEQKVDVYSGCR